MCNQMVSFYVPRGADYCEVEVMCGLTDPSGGRAICDTCASDPRTMADIQRHESSIAADNAWAASAGYGEY